MASIDELIQHLGLAIANRGPPPAFPVTTAMPAMPATGVIGQTAPPQAGLIERMLGTQQTNPNVPVPPGSGNGPGLPIPIQSAPSEITPGVLARLGEFITQNNNAPPGPAPVPPRHVPVPNQQTDVPLPPRPGVSLPPPPGPLPAQGQTILPGMMGGQGVPLPPGGPTLLPGMVPPGVVTTSMPPPGSASGGSGGAVPAPNDPSTMLAQILGYAGGEIGSPPPGVPSAAPPAGAPQPPAGAPAGPATGPGVSPPPAPGAAPQTGGLPQQAGNGQDSRDSTVVDSNSGIARFKDVLGVIGAILAQPIPAGGNQMSQIGKALAAGFIYNQGVEQNTQQQAQDKAKLDIAARRVAVDEAGLPLDQRRVAVSEAQQRNQAQMTAAQIANIAANMATIEPGIKLTLAQAEFARVRALAEGPEKDARIAQLAAHTELLKSQTLTGPEIAAARTATVEERKAADLEKALGTAVTMTGGPDHLKIDGILSARGYAAPTPSDMTLAREALARATAMGVPKDEAIAMINHNLRSQKKRPAFLSVPK